MPVKDKGKWSVLNNMEFMDRVRLQPEWYHYWIWYKKVLGIKIPLPGLGLHDKYGKEDRRNFQLQEIPMMAAVEYNKSETEKKGIMLIPYIDRNSSNLEIKKLIINIL